MRRRGLAAVLGGLLLCLVLPPVFAGLPLSGQRALVVLVMTIVLWTTRALDGGVAALLGVALLALTGATGGLRQALTGFANPVPHFLVGVLAMGVASRRAAWPSAARGASSTMRAAGHTGSTSTSCSRCP